MYEKKIHYIVDLFPMILVNPKTRHIVRKNLMYPNDNYIVVDHLGNDPHRPEEVAETTGSLHEAFSFFVNEGILKGKDWVELEDGNDIEEILRQAQVKLTNGELYYGSL